MFMSTPVKERTVVQIHSTTKAHHDIAADLLAIHGLTGAYTIVSLHRIGKGIVLKNSKKGGVGLW